MLKRRGTYPVHGYEVDSGGVLAPVALARYLLDLASQHAAELGCGVDAMIERGMTWVLSRLRVSVARPIVQGEVLTVETWPSGVERLFALRDFRLYDAEGAVVANAASQWLVLSLETRRALFPDEALDERVRGAAPHVFEEGFTKLPPLAGEPLDERRFDTRYLDIDHNLHVTSASTLAWSLESVPLDVWQSSHMSFFEIHYLAECFHPSSVVVRARRTGEAAFAHSVVREADQKEIARAITRWTTAAPG